MSLTIIYHIILNLSFIILIIRIIRYFRDLFKAIGFQTAPPILTTLTVITYGTIGILVFFTKKTLYLHQFFVICNCSLVSVFYLRMFSTHTEWFVLVCIIIWGKLMSSLYHLSNISVKPSLTVSSAYEIVDSCRIVWMRSLQQIRSPIKMTRKGERLEKRDKFYLLEKIKHSNLNYSIKRLNWFLIEYKKAFRCIRSACTHRSIATYQWKSSRIQRPSK